MVAHTIVPAVSSALNRKHASMACQGACASPKPATARVDSVHATYMNVMNRRGDRRCPMNSAAPIAPTPPIARMNPNVNGLPPQLFFTSRGSSTSCGPMNNRYANAAATSVPHSHTRSRTNRNPSRTSARAESALPPGRRWDAGS